MCPQRHYRHVDKSGEAVDFQEANPLISTHIATRRLPRLSSTEIFSKPARQSTNTMQEFWQDGAGKEEQKWDKDTISLAERF
jgi:hypothetical protein